LFPVRATVKATSIGSCPVPIWTLDGHGIRGSGVCGSASATAQITSTAQRESAAKKVLMIIFLWFSAKDGPV
jgi:hypothetical protein